MNVWEIIWIIIIVFSTLSFIYMSVKILYKGYDELMQMFENLKS